MTWLSFSTKSGSLLFVLPLVLTRFNTVEIATWYLFATIINMGAIADFGFRNTFIRLVSYGAGGATDIERFQLARPVAKAGGEISWVLIERLYSMMRRVYAIVALVALFLLSTGGTAALLKPISRIDNPRAAWLAWSVVCTSAIVEFYGKVYKNYLEGMNQIALVRRAETLSKLGSILTSLTVMVTAPSLLNLVLANRTWAVLNVLRDRFFARRIHERRLQAFRMVPFEPAFFWKVWEPAWRSGIGGVMSIGLTNMTGVLYAQIGTSAALASYLLGLRVITEIRDISNAPFYSKIPRLGRLRASGSLGELVDAAVRGMNMAYVTFTLGVVFVGLFSTHLLAIIHSRVTFVTPELWWLLAIAFMIHRIGSFHMQLYLTTNHVISHIVDGIAGAVFIAAAVLLLPSIGVFAFPVSMIAGYLGVYAWVSASFSFRSLPVDGRTFVRRFLTTPAVVLLLLTALFVYASVLDSGMR